MNDDKTKRRAHAVALFMGWEWVDGVLYSLIKFESDDTPFLWKSIFDRSVWYRVDKKISEDPDLAEEYMYNLEEQLIRSDDYDVVPNNLKYCLADPKIRLKALGQTETIQLLCKDLREG